MTEDGKSVKSHGFIDSSPVAEIVLFKSIHHRLLIVQSLKLSKL